jgi:hypothetical protein
VVVIIIIMSKTLLRKIVHIGNVSNSYTETVDSLIHLCKCGNLQLCHIYIDIDVDTEDYEDDPYACLGYYG